MTKVFRKMLVLIVAAAMLLSFNTMGMTAFADNEGPAETPVVTSITYPDKVDGLYRSGAPYYYDNNGEKVTVGYNYVRLSLKGSSLDLLKKSDFLFEVDGQTVDLDDSAAHSWARQFNIYLKDDGSAEIQVTFPENTLEQIRQCSITILCAEEGTANRTRTIPMDAKPVDPNTIFRLEPNDWYPTQTEAGTVVVRINSPAGLSFNVPDDEVRNYIRFAAEADKVSSNDIDLTADDSVTLENNVMTISLADTSAKLPAFLIFKRGLLKTPDGKTLGDRTVNGGEHYHYIYQSAHIESMSYNAVTFESGGGHVKASISGTNLDKSSPEPLFAKVFINNSSENTITIPSDEIEISSDGKKAELEFDVPENTTNKTVTYRIMPVVNGHNAIPTYIKGYDVISVLPEGLSTDAVTLSCIDIQGESDEDLSPERFVTEMKPEQFTAKFDLVIRGTNLNSRTALLKAVDENGVVWPLLPVYECGATFRWQNSAMYLPVDESLNEQHIELLIPRRLGVDRTFSFYIAPDGKNFDDDITATAVIRNDGIFDYEDMTRRHFTQEDFTQLKTVVVKYVDEQGNELAPADSYKGYGMTELYHQGIGPKEIDGYRLKSYSPPTLDMMLEQPRQLPTGEFYFDDGQWFIRDLNGEPIVYTYERDERTPEQIQADYEAKMGDALAARDAYDSIRDSGSPKDVFDAAEAFRNAANAALAAAKDTRDSGNVESAETLVREAGSAYNDALTNKLNADFEEAVRALENAKAEYESVKDSGDIDRVFDAASAFRDAASSAAIAAEATKDDAKKEQIRDLVSEASEAFEAAKAAKDEADRQKEGQTQKEDEASKAAQERYNALAAKYAPGKVQLKKTAKGNKRVTLTWKTIKTGVNGYQVMISDKATGNVVVSKNIKQTKKMTRKKTIKKVVKSKKLKKGSYTVQMRAYCCAEGEVFYGEWSNAKGVKIKK